MGCEGVLALLPREKVAGEAGRMRANLGAPGFSLISHAARASFSRREKRGEGP